MLLADLDLSPSYGTALAACALAVGASGMLLAGRAKAAETTLLAAWAWVFAAVWAVAGAEILVGLSQPARDAAWVAPLRFSAAVLSLCPLMSLLGAKRPQNGPWQFVVISLWGVLALPAAEAFFLHRAAEFEVSGVRSWFLLALIVMGLMNHLPTRHAGAAVLAAIAQILLLAGPLPGRLALDGGLAALGGLIAGALAIALASQRRAAAPLSPLDRLWKDFRDAFGAFWALRMADRVNIDANQLQWPLRLSWSGFEILPDESSAAPASESGEQRTAGVPPEAAQSARFTFTSLLRRFVSDAWIAKRIEESINLKEELPQSLPLTARKERIE